MTSLHAATIGELAPRLRRRELSATELVEAHLERIAELDDHLGAFITVTGDAARAAAAQTDARISAGDYRGPLDGIPVAHKDNLDLAGVPTTAGSRVHGRPIAETDATTVAALREAGVIALGKLNLIEYASGSMGLFGFAQNPRRPGATPGGSSSGSGTAVSAGLVTAALGTDTGGSIRHPASFCGVFGMRPTYDRFSRAGCVPLSWSQDTVGPLTRSAEDLGIVLDALRGSGFRDAGASGDVVGLRFAVPGGFYRDGVDPEIVAAIEAYAQRLEAAGAHRVEVDLAGTEFAPAASWTIAYTEAFTSQEALFREYAPLYTAAFRTKIVAAGLMSADDLLVSQQIRETLAAVYEAAFQRVDVLLTPTSRVLPTSATLSFADAEGLRWTDDMASTTRPTSLLGLPAASVPVGVAADGAPIGMQVTGRAWDEASVLRIASLAGVVRPAEPDPRTLPPRSQQTFPDTTSLHRGATPGIDSEWVRHEARLRSLEYITEEDARTMAPMIATAKAQLIHARVELPLVEPRTRTVAR